MIAGYSGSQEAKNMPTWLILIRVRLHCSPQRRHYFVSRTLGAIQSLCGGFLGSGSNAFRMEDTNSPENAAESRFMKSCFMLRHGEKGSLEQTMDLGLGSLLNHV